MQASAPATGSLPYTVYFANLHSQTNHSDGGGELTSCTGAHEPLSAPYGPADAYAYASDVMVRNMMHRDAEEGIGAFIDKRSPDCGLSGRKGIRTWNVEGGSAGKPSSTVGQNI